jgi:ribosomal protein L40E
MYCIKCGTQLPDDAVYCSKCGFAQRSDKLEYKTIKYNNKNKALAGLTCMEADGWRLLFCQRPHFIVGLSPLVLLSWLAAQQHIITFERGTPNTPYEEKQYKTMHQWADSLNKKTR